MFAKKSEEKKKEDGVEEKKEMVEKAPAKKTKQSPDDLFSEVMNRNPSREEYLDAMGDTSVTHSMLWHAMRAGRG